MRVTVDGTELELLPGMTVLHAILARYGGDDEDLKVTDRWGNQVGLSGALTDGMQLKTERQPVEI